MARNLGRMVYLVVCLHTIGRGVLAEFAFEITQPADHARAIATALSLYDLEPFWRELEIQTELIEFSELGIPLTPISSDR